MVARFHILLTHLAVPSTVVQRRSEAPPLLALLCTSMAEAGPREEATETEALPLTSPHARPVPGFFTLT